MTNEKPQKFLVEPCEECGKEIDVCGHVYAMVEWRNYRLMTEDEIEKGFNDYFSRYRE